MYMYLLIDIWQSLYVYEIKLLLRNLCIHVLCLISNISLYSQKDIKIL